MKEYMNHLEDSMFKTHIPRACVTAVVLLAVSLTAEAQAPAEKALSTEKATSAEDTLKNTYRSAASKYALEFDITELNAEQVRAKADELAREAGKAYQSGAYQKAVDLYMQAIKILQKLGDDPTSL